MDSAQSSRTVGYVGLGSMGGRIAMHLCRVGFKLAVYDIDPEAVDRLVAEGAFPVDSLGQLVSNADSIVVCVDPEEVVMEVVEALVPHLRRGQSVIIQSSVAPSLLSVVQEMVAPSGAQLYDAPVSGSIDDRLNGTLSVLVGAKEGDIESDLPLLNAIGHPMFFDVLGGGEIAKLCNNAIMTTTRTVASEVMNFAAAYGLSEDSIRRAASISSGRSWVLENWKYFDKRLVDGETLRTSSKQVEHILAAASARSVSMKMLSAVREHGRGIDSERLRLLRASDNEQPPSVPSD